MKRKTFKSSFRDSSPWRCFFSSSSSFSTSFSRRPQSFLLFDEGYTVADEDELEEEDEDDEEEDGISEDDDITAESGERSVAGQMN